MVKTGLDILSDGNTSFLKGLKIGLAANPASVNKNYEHAAEILMKENGWKLKALFGPQHGWFGDTQDNMIEWEGGTGLKGIPLYSLYGKVREPTENMLKGLDAVLVDFQDVGCRVYTFIQTLYLIIKACFQLKKLVIVLDRPNPIGNTVEGPVLQKEFTSFIGFTSIPLRHGKTIGQLARYYRDEWPCELNVIEMQDYDPKNYFDETGLPWVIPSPNMPSLNTAIVYPGIVLLEGTNISEGRGTTQPFELVGAPNVNASKIADYLNGLSLDGVHFRPHYFTPTFNKWKETLCGGVQIHVTDRKCFHAVKSGSAVLNAFKLLFSGFEWLKPPYEYEYEKMPIDILTGSDNIRKMIDANDTLESIFNYIDQI
jgi:uncharacterized protein YbbC (DUF1343 family)